jgi:UDP-N-acetylglucosamine 4-epimerase
MTEFERVQIELRSDRGTWTVTGAGGFIGSHLVETLLSLDQTVVGLDNFSTGKRENLDDVRASVGEARWKRFSLVEGDIRDPESCAQACEGADYLLHQAALGSVPRSIADPATSTAVNVDGFVNMMVAAREAQVRRVVFASSSSVYGDHPGLPKVEDKTGTPLSPYAVTKCTNELFASVFHRIHEMEIIGLRYFNVFGPRQDPHGAYAAVIPRWIQALCEGAECTIFGDGLTSRDFSYVANVVQANILAATCKEPAAIGEIFNVAIGGRVTLAELYSKIYAALRECLEDGAALDGREQPKRGEFRMGDVKHSNADISKAVRMLGFSVADDVASGMAKTIDWYVSRAGKP